MTQRRERKPTDWTKRFSSAKPAHTVLLPSDFAGVKAGTTMFIGTPEIIANYAARIPPGETRSVARMRNELARRHGAQSTCPVTTAIYLRIVAEKAIAEIDAGTPGNQVAPFWRVIEPDSALAKKLSRPELLDHMRMLERGAQ